MELSQIAACHRLHEAEQRLFRWLLTVRDRTQNDVLNLTQDFLSMMLGSRRTTVTAIAGSLQAAVLIEYRRGRIKILDAPGRQACVRSELLGWYDTSEKADLRGLVARSEVLKGGHKILHPSS